MLDERYDLVVVGGGVAGLYTAANTDPSVKILLLTKRQEELSNSSLAQGGVAAVVDKTHDDFKLHIADTLIAGGYQNDMRALEVLVTEGPDCVLDLLNYGVDFDADATGKLSMTLEAGHSRNRILHHKDTTGHEMVIKLLEAVKHLPNVTVCSDTTVYDLQKTEGGFSVGLLLDGGGHTDVLCRYCVLATGGIGRAYKYTTNSAIATGDGIMLAHDLGAEIRNLSFVQFHPTAFAADEGRERFLISEAVRGEGAYLLNSEKRRFMFDYDQRGELAPRDVVSRHVLEESKKTGSERFYLDITHKDPAFVRDRFPGIYSRCLEEGVDITKDLIPVFPCQHYLMGGINVDVWAHTDVPGLYAVGECSHTGVHGKNRLASNSLLEALVFARRAALDVSRRLKEEPDVTVAEGKPWYREGKIPMPHGLRTEIRETLQNACFVFPDKEAIDRDLPTIQRILVCLEQGDYETDRDLLEARAIATVACIIMKELQRKLAETEETRT